MKKINASTFTFRLPNGLRSKLETIADDNEVSLSELVRYSLKSLANNE
jgi:predicted HicB family RNase H-like nuclease